jgi:general secretion pathway protein C
VTKIDDAHFVVSTSLFDLITANPGSFSRGARVVPAMKNGQPSGFKLYAIRPSSLYSELGLTNGDTITAYNGKPLLTFDDVPDPAALRRTRKIVLDVVRRGKSIQLEYTLK